jgi:hypothetical protein
MVASASLIQQKLAWPDARSSQALERPPVAADRQRLRTTGARSGRVYWEIGILAVRALRGMTGAVVQSETRSAGGRIRQVVSHGLAVQRDDLTVAIDEAGAAGETLAARGAGRGERDTVGASEPLDRARRQSPLRMVTGCSFGRLAAMNALMQASIASSSWASLAEAALTRRVAARTASILLLEAVVLAMHEAARLAAN